MVLLDAIGDYLISEGLVDGSTSWPLKKGFLPDDSDQAVALFETGGAAPQNPTGTQDIFYATFQVRVRGSVLDYEVTRAKMQAIITSLHDATIAGLIYTFLTQSGPIPLGNDENNRPNLVINFTTMEVR